jgi:hypothetical protein
MWITKDGASASKKQPSKPFSASKALPAAQPKELHVPHNVEMEISAFLVQHGRLEMRIGRHLMHFANITRNGDGSVDYLIRSRMHTHTGLERNFESHVRIHRDHRLQLIR